MVFVQNSGFNQKILFSKVGTMLGSAASLGPIYLVYHLIKSEVNSSVAVATVSETKAKEEESKEEKESDDEEQPQQEEQKKGEEKNDIKTNNETITKVTLELISGMLSVLSVFGSNSN